MGLTADQAIRMTPLLLAGVILAGGFAVLAHLAPKGAIDKPDIRPVGVESPQDSGSLQDSWPKTDWLAITDTLRELNHNTTQDPDAPGGKGDPAGPDGPIKKPDEPTDNTDTPYVTGDFKFLGAIVKDDGSAALIEASGRQKFVRPGEEVADHTIISIHRDHLIVEIEGARKRMELADRDRADLNSIERYRRDTQRAAAAQRLRDQRSRPQPIQPDSDR